MAAHRKIVLALIGIIAVVLAAPVVLLLSDAGRIPHTEQTRQKLLLYDGSEMQLTSGISVAQEFEAFYPGLSQIEVLLAGSSMEGQQAILHLRHTCQSASDIFTGSVPVAAQTGPQFYTVTLPQPLDDSAGQSYCLLLEASREGIELPLSDGDLYPHGRLNIYRPTPEPRPVSTPAVAGGEMRYKIFLPLVLRSEEQAPNADIGFLLHYDGLPGPTLQTFVARLTANKPYFWGSVWFYGGLLLIYLGLLAGLAVVAWRSVRPG